MQETDPRNSRPKTPWTGRRILRMALPSLVVLVMAWVLRNQPDTTLDQPREPSEPPRLVAPSEPALVPAPAARLLILGADDGEALATALRARVGQDVVVVVLPAARREAAALAYGIAEFPAVVIERDGAKQDACTGPKAQADAVLARCRELGWQVK